MNTLQSSDARDIWGAVLSGILLVACGGGVEHATSSGAGGASSVATNATVAVTSSAASSVTTTSTGAGASGGSAPEPVVCDPTGPSPQLLAMASQPGAALAVGPTHVVWLEPKMNAAYDGDGSVHAMPRCGGTVTLVAEKQPFPIDVAIDGVTIFWTNVGTVDYPEGAVLRATIGDLPTMMTYMEDNPLGIVVDDENVYWLSMFWGIRGLPHQAVNEFATTFVDNAYGDALAMDGTQFYWASGAGLATASSPGGDPVLLDETSCSPALASPGVAFDASHVYWIDGCGLLRSVPKGGGEAVSLASGQLAAAPVSRRIAVDDLYVYWLNEAELMRIAKAGGTPEPLAPAGLTTLGYVGAVALTETDIYWSAQMGIWRLTKL